MKGSSSSRLTRTDAVGYLAVLVWAVVLSVAAATADETEDIQEYVEFVTRDIGAWTFGSSSPFAQVSATSKLAWDGHASYTAAEAVDGDLETAWAEGVRGPGIGERIAFELPAGTQIVRVLPGNGTGDLFWKNNRISRALLSVFSVAEEQEGNHSYDVVSDRVFMREVMFSDEPLLQDVDLGTTLLLNGGFLAVLEILDVYKGQENDNTCIAEIQAALRSATESIIRAVARGENDSVIAGLLERGFAPDIYLGPDWPASVDGGRLPPLMPPGQSLLGWAVQERRPELVRSLLAAGANPDILAAGKNLRAGQGTPLSIALLNSDFEIADKLISAGAATVIDLMKAVLNRKENVVRFLVDRGADPNRALFFAVEEGGPDIVALLLAAGADVNAANYQGNTPLHFAVRVIDLDEAVAMATLLLAAGANVNAANESGDTPLHHAAERNDPDAAAAMERLMLAAGADQHASNNDSLTPRELAALVRSRIWAKEYVGFALDTGNGEQFLDALPSATSALPADRWGDYSASSAVDGDLATTWAEGVQGPGIGERIAFSLPAGTHIVRVAPGYGTEAGFWKNNRVRRAKLSVFSGTQEWDTGWGFVSLRDEIITREFVFDEVLALQDLQLGTTLEPKGREQFFGVLEVLEVYKGTAYDDTCVAEIQAVVSSSP